MSQFLRVTGNLTELVEERILHSAPTDQVIPFLATPIDFQMLALPNGTRHVSSTGDGTITNLIVEQQPTVRTITINDHSTTGRSQHRIAIPWTYFVFTATRPEATAVGANPTLSGWHVFCAPQRVNRLDDPIYALPTNNVYRDGNICFGTAATDPGQNIGEHIDGLVTAFWNSNFNQDVRPTLPFGSYEAWATHTAEDPNCWQQWDWTTVSEAYELQRLFSIEPNRTTRIETTNGIPDLPMQATWGRVLQWVNSELTSDQQRLLRLALQDAETNG